jgi:hypothetical protein
LQNAYIELLWVTDAAEVRREPAGRTRIWERWVGREAAGVCPFGIVLRAGPDSARPFEMWTYHPQYLPVPLGIGIARDTPLTEPEYFYLDFQRDRARPTLEPVSHAIAIQRLTGITIGMPARAPRSAAAQALESTKLLTFEDAADYALHLTFDDGRRSKRIDLRPELPAVLHW